RDLRERGEYHSRLHGHQHVSEAVGGVGLALAQTYRSVDRVGARRASRARLAQDHVSSQVACKAPRPSRLNVDAAATDGDYEPGETCRVPVDPARRWRRSRTGVARRARNFRNARGDGSDFHRERVDQGAVLLPARANCDAGRRWRTRDRRARWGAWRPLASMARFGWR